MPAGSDASSTEMSYANPQRPFQGPSAPLSPRTVPVLGIPLADRLRAHVDWIDAMVERRERGYVIAAAVHCVMVAQEDAELRDAVLNASLTLPDGQPSSGQ